MYKSVEEFKLLYNTSDAALKDERICVEKDGKTIQLRHVAYRDSEKQKVYEFIANNFTLCIDKIVDIYKHRW